MATEGETPEHISAEKIEVKESTCNQVETVTDKTFLDKLEKVEDRHNLPPETDKKSTKVADVAVAPDAMVDPDIEGKLSISRGEKLLESASLVNVSSEETRELSKQSTCSQLDTVTDKTSLEELAKVEDTEAAELAVTQDAMVDPDTEGKFSIYGGEKLLESASLVKVSSEETHELSKDSGENEKPVHTKIEVLESDSQMPKDQADKLLKATCGVIEVEKISTCGEKVSTETSLENANTQDNGLARSSELSTENMKDEDYMGEKPAVDLDLQEGKTADRDSEFQEEKEHKYEELSDVIQTSIGIVSHQLVQFPVTASNEETIEASCASQNIEEEKAETSPQNGETEGKKLSEDSDAESAKEALQKIEENLGQDQEDASPTPDVIKQILKTDVGIVGEPKIMEQGIDNKTEEEAYNKDEGINNNLDIHITPIKNKAKQYSSQEEEFEAREQEIPFNFADLPVCLEVVNQEDETGNDNNENAKDSLDTLMVTTKKVEEDAYSKEDAIDNNSNVHIMPIKYEAKQSSSQEEDDTDKELTSNFADPPIRLETVKQEDETGNDKMETAKDSLDNLMVASTKKMEEVCSKDEGIENKLGVYIMTIKQEDKQSSSLEKEFENKEKEITSKLADLPICMETVSQENESGNDKYENAKDSMDNLMTVTKEMEEEAYSKDKEIDNNLDVHIMPIKHEAKQPSSQEEGLVDKEQEITSNFEDLRICPESINQEDETGNDKNENANDSLKVETTEEVILEIDDDTSHQFDPSLHKTGIDETSSLGAKAEESGPPPFTSCHSLDETSLETTDPSKKLNNDNIMEPQILDDNIIKHERVESRDEEISDQKLPEEQSEIERLKRPMVVAYEGLEDSASGRAERDTYVKERGDESNGSDENVMNHAERNQNPASENLGDISESGVAEEHEEVTENKQVGENLEEENTVESIESESTGTTLINQAKTTEEATKSGCTQACNKESEKIREIEELDSDNKLENIVSKEFREECITEEGITDPYLHKGEDRITHKDGDVKDQNIVSLGFETSIDSFQIYKQDDYNFEEKTSEAEYENQTYKIQDADDTAGGISSEEVNEKPKMNDEGEHAQKYPEDDCIVTDLTTMSIGHVQEEDTNKTGQEVNEELETETADRYSKNQKAQEAEAMEVNFTVPKRDENEMDEPKGEAFDVLEIADAEKDIGEQIVEETAAMGVTITTIGEEESVNESYQENEVLQAHKTNKSAVKDVFTENQIKEDLSVAVLSMGYIEKAVEMISKECEGSEVIEISATEKNTAEPIMEHASSVSVGDESTIKNSQEDRQDKKKHHLEAKEPDLIPTELNFEASDSTHRQENLLKDENQYTNSNDVDSKETTEELLQKESSEDISDTSILVAMVHKEEIQEGVIEQEENTTDELRITPNTKITENSSSNEIEPECEGSKGTDTSAAEKDTAEPIMELASTESVGDETTISNSQEDEQDKKKQNLESRESDLIPMELKFEASDSTHGQENLLNDEKQLDAVDSMETTEELLEKESSEEISDTSILDPMVHKGETEEEIIEQEENTIHEQTASNTKTTENSSSNEIEPECEGYEGIETFAVEKDTAELIMELASSVSVGDETTISNSQEDVQDKKRQNLEDRESDLILELKFEASDSTHGQENLLNDEKQYMNQDAVDSKETSEELLQKESNEEISDTSILVPMVHKEEIREGIIEQEENTIHDLRSASNTKVTENSSSNEIEPEYEGFEGVEISAVEKDTAEPIMELASSVSVGDETTIRNSQEGGQDQKKQNLEARESDSIPMELNCEVSDSTYGQEKLLNDEKLYISPDAVDSKETTEDELLQKESSEEIGDTSILVPIEHKEEIKEGIMEQEENTIHELRTAANTKLTENSSSKETRPECEKSIHMPDILETDASGTYVENNSCEKEQTPMENLNKSSNEERDGIDTKVRDDIGENGSQNEEVVAFSNPSGEESVQGVSGEVSNVEREENFQENGAHLKVEDYITETTIAEQEENLDGATSSKPIQTSEIECVKVGQTHESDSMEAVENNDDKENIEGATSNKEKTSNEIECRDIKERNIEKDGHIEDQNIFLLRRETSLHRCHEDEEQKKIDEREPDEKDEDQILDVEDTSIHNEEVCDEPTTGDVGEDRENREEHCSVEDRVIASIREDTVEESPDREKKEANKPDEEVCEVLEKPCTDDHIEKQNIHEDGALAEHFKVPVVGETVTGNSQTDEKVAQDNEAEIFRRLETTTGGKDTENSAIKDLVLTKHVTASTEERVKESSHDVVHERLETSENKAVEDQISQDDTFQQCYTLPLGEETTEEGSHGDELSEEPNDVTSKQLYSVLLVEERTEESSHKDELYEELNPTGAREDTGNQIMINGMGKGANMVSVGEQKAEENCQEDQNNGTFQGEVKESDLGSPDGTTDSTKEMDPVTLQDGEDTAKNLNSFNAMDVPSEDITQKESSDHPSHAFPLSEASEEQITGIQEKKYNSSHEQETDPIAMFTEEISLSETEPEVRKLEEASHLVSEDMIPAPTKESISIEEMKPEGTPNLDETVSKETSLTHDSRENDATMCEMPEGVSILVLQSVNPDIETTTSEMITASKSVPDVISEKNSQGPPVLVSNNHDFEPEDEASLQDEIRDENLETPLVEQTREMNLQMEESRKFEEDMDMLSQDIGKENATPDVEPENLSSEMKDAILESWKPIEVEECNNNGKSETSEPPGLEHNKSEVKDQCDVFSNEHETIGAYVNIKKHSLQDEDPTKKEDQDRSTIDGIIVDNTPVEVNAKDDNREIESSNILQQEDCIIVDNVLVEEDPTKEENQRFDRSTRDCIIMDNTPDEVKAKDDSHETESSNILQQEDPIKECLINEDMLVEKHNLLQEDPIQKEDQSLDGSRKDCTIIEDMLVAIKAKDDSHQTESSNTTRTENITQTLEVIDLGEKVEYASELRDQDDRHKALPKTEKTEWEKAREIVVDQYTVSFENQIDSERSQKKENEKNNLEVGHKLDYDNQNDETNGAIDVGEAIKNKTQVREKTIAEEPVEGKKDAEYPYKEVCGELDTACTDEHIEKQQIIPKDDTVMEHVSRNTGEQTIVDACKNGDMVEHEAEVSRDLEVCTDTERHILQENDVSMDQSPTYVREAAVQVWSQEGEEAKNPQKVYPELETTSRTEDIGKEIMEEKEEDVEVYNTVSIEQEIVREISQEDEEVEKKIGEVFDGINTVIIRNDTEEHVMEDDIKESSREEELNEEVETVGAREDAENYTVEDRAGTEICLVSISEQTTEESSQENKEKEIKQEGEVKESILKSIEGATDSTEEIDLQILKNGEDQNMSSSAFNPTEAPSEQITLKDKTEVSHASSISAVSQEQIKEYSEKNENARNNLEITSIAKLNEEMSLYESETDGGKPVDDPDLSSEERIPAPTNASSIGSRSQDIEHVKFEETFNLDENVTNEVIFTEDSGPNQGKQEMDEMHVGASVAIPPQSVDQTQNTEITTATDNTSFTSSSDDKSKEKSQELSISANIYEFNSTKANEEIKKETTMKDQFRDEDLETALVAQTLQMEEPRKLEENSEIGYEDIGVESPIPQLDPERLSAESNETILEREKVIELTEFSENITLKTPELGLEKNSSDCKDQFDTLSNELEAVQAYGHMERDIPQQQDSNNEDGQSFTRSRKEILIMEETLVENEAKDHSHETDHFNTISNQTLAQTLETFDLSKKLENVSDTRIPEQNQQTLPETEETELEKEKEMVKDQDVVFVEDQINDQQFEEVEMEGKNLEAGPKSDADYQNAEANYANSLLIKIPHSVQKNDESEAIEEEIMEGEANDKDVEVTTVNRSVQEVKESYISGEQNSEARDSEENTDIENWSYFEHLIKKANSYPDEEASGEKIQNKESGDMTYSENSPVIIAKNEEKILESKHKAEIDTESTAVCSEEKILKTIETDTKSVNNKNFNLEITSNLVSELPTVQNENKNQENHVVENNKAEDTKMVDLGNDEPLKNSERSIKQDQENDEAVNLKIESADFKNSEKNIDDLPNLATTQSLAELTFSGFGGECEEDSNHESDKLDRAMESMYETQIHETLIAAKESEYNEYEGITKNHDTSFITEDSAGKSFQKDKDGNENQMEADTKFDGRAKQNENDTNENETDNIEVSMPHENECATDNIQILGKEAFKEPDLLDSVVIKIQESQGENEEGDKIKEESTSMGSEEQIHEKQAKEAQRLPEDCDNISGSKEIVKESTGGEELLEYAYNERPQGDEMDEYQIKIQTIKLEPEVANQELDSGEKTNENTEKESVNEEVSQSPERAAASQNILEQINEEKKSSYGIYSMPIDKEKIETTHQDDEMDEKTVKNEESKVHIECQDELSDRDHTIENEEAKSSEQVAVEPYIETTDPNAKRETVTSGDGGEDIQSNAMPPRHTQFPGAPTEALKKLDEQSDLVPEELIHDTIKENAEQGNETEDANVLEDILEMEKPSESASNLTSTTEKSHGEEVSNVHHDASSLMEASKMATQMKEGNSAEVEEIQSIVLAKETTEVNLTPEVRGENIPDETPLEEISDSDLKKLDELNIQERICARKEETLQTPEKNTPQETGTHEETSYLTAEKHTHGEASSIENTEAETSVRTTDIPPTSMIITEKSLHCDEVEDQKRGEALLTESKLEVESGGGKSIPDLGEEKIDELKLSEFTSVSPSDLLQRSMKDTEQMVGHSDKTNLSGNKELENKEAPTSQVEEEAEAEEEKDQGETDEHKNVDSGSDAPIMVEASRDIDVKPTHKKSHNILSGVGSKVKQSISKVKKAITGKSSHHKQQSPK